MVRMIVLTVLLACSSFWDTMCTDDHEDPTITSVTIEPHPVPAGSQAILWCYARDNEDHFLEYRWEATEGLIWSGPTKEKAHWESPDSVGTYRIRVTVTDDGCGKAWYEFGVQTVAPDTNDTRPTAKAVFTYPLPYPDGAYEGPR